MEQIGKKLLQELKLKKNLDQKNCPILPSQKYANCLLLVQKVPSVSVPTGSSPDVSPLLGAWCM